MKKLLLLILTLFAVVTLSACSDVCIGTSCIEEPIEVDEDCEDTETEATLENVIYYDHINGHGDINENHEAFILFEEEMLAYVKYQVAYLSCTCRPSDVNYWQVMYIEVNKYTNDVKLISFTHDDPTSTHPYTAGLWGDSSPTPGGKTLEDFTEEFIPWFIGKSMEDFQGISIFLNEEYLTSGIENTVEITDAIYTDDESNEINLIDDYAGSSVTTNNMLRIVKSILAFHEENYN